MSCKQHEIEPVDCFVGFSNGEIIKNGKIGFGQKFKNAKFFADKNNTFIAEGSPTGTPAARVIKNGQTVYQEKAKLKVAIADFFVEGDDWYLLGTETDSLDDSFHFLLKNGVKQRLNVPWDYFFEPRGIAVSKGSIYIIGHTSIVDVNNQLWKDGQLIDVPQLKEFYDIQADGQDVYIAGKNKANEFQLWKNSVPIDMSKVFRPRYASEEVRSVFVENGNIYLLTTVPLISGRVCTWWKNGEPNLLFPPKSDKVFVLSMFVKNDQVYITGFEITTTDCFQKPLLWRNGVLMDVYNGLDCPYPFWVFVR